jgi:hypothetical protein
MFLPGYSSLSVGAATVKVRYRKRLVPTKRAYSNSLGWFRGKHEGGVFCGL